MHMGTHTTEIPKEFCQNGNILTHMKKRIVNKKEASDKSFLYHGCQKNQNNAYPEDK